jgi:hypothetical protein
MAENKMGVEQYGFKDNRSTVDLEVGIEKAA